MHKCDSEKLGILSFPLAEQQMHYDIGFNLIAIGITHTSMYTISTMGYFFYNLGSQNKKQIYKGMKANDWQDFVGRDAGWEVSQEGPF